MLQFELNNIMYTNMLIFKVQPNITFQINKVTNKNIKAPVSCSTRDIKNNAQKTTNKNKN